MSAIITRLFWAIFTAQGAHKTLSGVKFLIPFRCRIMSGFDFNLATPMIDSRPSPVNSVINRPSGVKTCTRLFSQSAI